jgi:hypothetical protein
MAEAPTHCPNGHALGPGQVSSGTAAGQHHLALIAEQLVCK